VVVTADPRLPAAIEPGSADDVVLPPPLSTVVPIVGSAPAPALVADLFSTAGALPIVLASEASGELRLAPDNELEGVSGLSWSDDGRAWAAYGVTGGMEARVVASHRYELQLEPIVTDD
jgi:hypothetical protein